MTTVTSDSRSLAIPCFALAPNCLMLAVVIFPHGSITVLTDAATLSQAHLIQPGRALRAEPQVRSSFRESLQLYMQLRVALQSSTPITCTFPASGRGTRKRGQSRLASEIPIPSLSLSCSPPLPHIANPMSCTDVRKRLVRREEASMKSGSRSANTLRKQSGLRQKNLRTVNTKRMGRPTQGRSRGCLWYEL